MLNNSERKNQWCFHIFTQEAGGKNTYSLTGSRIPYLRNKAVDDRFFILTFFAIAYEIKEAGAYDPDEIMDVQFAVGLPPAHCRTV